MESVIYFVEIETVCVSCAHSTFVPSDSAIKRTGTRVLPFTIVGGTSRGKGLPLKRAVKLPTVRLMIFCPLVAVTVDVAASHFTFAPNASKMPRSGTSVLPSTIVSWHVDNYAEAVRSTGLPRDQAKILVKDVAEWSAVMQDQIGRILPFLAGGEDA